jgi:hypothetical protein
MISAEEIKELKKARRALEERMAEKLDKSKCDSVVYLSGWMKDIIDGIQSVQDKEKALSNLAMSPRIKLGKKAMVLGKELIRFEMGLVGEFNSQNISEDLEKRFISIIRLIRDNKLQGANDGMKYFEEIAALDRECGAIDERVKREDHVLAREQLKIENLLKEMAGLERETVDLEKVRRHKELLESLEKLKRLREAYIQSLLSRPVAELLGKTEFQPLKECCGIFQEEGEMAQLRQFFSDYPVFGKCSASQICGFFDCSEKKLSHVCPEISRFKKAVLGNRSLFESIRSLDQTAFLAVDDENEKALDFYARNVKGAQEAVERIRQLKKESGTDRAEYEKSKLMEKRREELAKYSKTELENELKTIKSLLEALHSEVIEGNADKGKGLLSEISGFIKRLSGDS